MFRLTLRAALIVAALANASLAAAMPSTEPAAFAGPAGLIEPPADPSTATASPSPELAGELAGELRQRQRDKTVHELRRSANGEYGVSLWIADDEVRCFVALEHQGNLWRILQFDALAPAERAYAQLVKLSVDWSADIVRKQALAAQKRELERVTRESEARAATLQREMATARAQRQRIAEEQKAARVDVQAAEIESRAMRIRLETLRRQIQSLEADLSQIEGGGAEVFETPASRQAR